MKLLLLKSAICSKTTIAKKRQLIFCQRPKFEGLLDFPLLFFVFSFLLRQAPQKNERKEGEEREVENPFPSYVTSPYNLADKKRGSKELPRRSTNEIFVNSF